VRGVGHDNFTPGEAALQRLKQANGDTAGPARSSAKTGKRIGFSRSNIASILTSEQKARIVAYAAEHGDKAAADYFCVSKDRVRDLRDEAKGNRDAAI